MFLTPNAPAIVLMEMHKNPKRDRVQTKWLLRPIVAPLRVWDPKNLHFQHVIPIPIVQRIPHAGAQSDNSNQTGAISIIYGFEPRFERHIAVDTYFFISKIN